MLNSTTNNSPARDKGQCSYCSSYAINPGHHGRGADDDPDLCDVCYWRVRSEFAAQREKRLEAELESLKKDTQYLHGAVESLQEKLRRALDAIKQAELRGW